jgi:putative membrane protein
LSPAASLTGDSKEQTTKMPQSPQTPQPPATYHGSTSDYLAAERNFLAWIRTGLALMGFGFVVARFGLFLQEIHIVEPSLRGEHHYLSIWFGTALIAAGVIVALFSSWSHIRLVHELNRGERDFTRPSTGAITLAVFLALVGITMAVYLLTV